MNEAERIIELEALCREARDGVVRAMVDLLKSPYHRDLTFKELVKAGQPYFTLNQLLTKLEDAVGEGEKAEALESC